MSEPAPSLLRDSIGSKSICGLGERINAIFPEFEQQSFENSALKNFS